MLRSKVMACLLVAAIGTVAIGGTLGASAMAKKPGCQMAKTPLGRLIMGNLGRLLVLKSELNVTDEQHEQIHGIIVENKGDIAEVAEGIWRKRSALRDSVLAEKPDESTIRKAADELGDAIGDAAVLASKLAGRVRPILTDEQRERIEKCRVDCHKAVEKFFEKAAKAD
jgi:Spy/CpxP family protein refolding chaperone